MLTLIIESEVRATENSRERFKRELSDTVSFNLNDTYFSDDDVPYSAFCGEDAAEIIFPTEETVTEKNEAEKANVKTQPPENAAPVKNKVRQAFTFTDILYIAEEKTE